MPASKRRLRRRVPMSACPNWGYIGTTAGRQSTGGTFRSDGYLQLDCRAVGGNAVALQDLSDAATRQHGLDKAGEKLRGCGASARHAHRLANGHERWVEHA